MKAMSRPYVVDILDKENNYEYISPEKYKFHEVDPFRDTLCTK